MPISVTYPGVYVEELGSGPTAITPATTSVCAFIGRAPFGPTDRTVTIFSFGDFTRQFGGLQFDYPMSYAVQDFFANGGSQAIIARLFEPEDGKGDGVAQLEFPGAPPMPAEEGEVAPTLLLTAANPGAWGNDLVATVDSQGITPATAKQFTAEYGLEANDLFNLTLTRNDANGKIVATERYLNLSVKATGDAARFPNRIDRVLKGNSNMARVGALSAVPPDHGASARGIGGNAGQQLSAATYIGDQDGKTGIYLLEHERTFNLLCIPPDVRIFPDAPGGQDLDLDPAVRQAAASYCAERRAFYIVDPPADWMSKARQGQISAIDPESLQITGETRNGLEVARNAAVFFPRIWKEDLLMKSQLALFAPCGAVAGVMAANDVGRGVWKAAAGIDAGLANVVKFELNLTDDEIGQLNRLGINCLRKLPVYGPVIWGARTLRGADQFADDYKYIPVRRLTLFIEGSLMAGTQWAVFEPNDEALWSSLRLGVSSFLADLSRQGAFYDYSVKCDAGTTTQEDIDNGIVNILVLIAPVKPAEFVVIQIQQIAGGTPG